ncbi:MAG: S8 family serine peptidase [Steroidobacteraceae bacterium]
MKGSTLLKLVSSCAVLVATSSALSGSLTPAQLSKASQLPVIVILKDQLPSVPPSRESTMPRAAAISTAQADVLSLLQRSGPHSVHSFSTINAFATQVTAGEATALASHPDVQAVVPDAMIRAPRLRRDTTGSGRVAASSTTTDDGLCNTLEPEALQLTHTAYLDTSLPQAQEVVDGNGEKVTGKGVKVAWIADGVNIHNPSFIRPDGSPVFIDYEDFSGDPAGTPTDGGEAYLDASSIAAQDMPHGKLLTYDISQYVAAAHPLPSPCKIQIRGMAPGASLVGLKVFSFAGFTTTSYFVQAIEWAVVHDKVDVLNESFGGNPYPDNINDPISLADAAAVAAGVTVTVSSGDGGTSGTLGSPATSLEVIAAGATTQYRSYVQTTYGAQALVKVPGWISNNISPFSSGGFAQSTARTVDVVAPGDLGWAACSTDEALYNDCSNYNGGPTPIQQQGGTSESAPLTAGEAALIIQAYRSTHHGKNPTPALVKQIIMSTANDISAPAFEQGAGLIDALAAVNLALSIQDANGAPKSQAGGLLLSPTSAIAIAEPNTSQRLAVTLTNTSASKQHLTPALEILGPPIAGATTSVNLDPSTDPTFPNVTGSPRSYVTRTFRVPTGAAHLDASIAWQETPTASLVVYLSLIDPSGRQAVYSVPQGFGQGYAHVDVVKPAGGTWTAVFFTRPAGVAASYSGPVQFTWAAEDYARIGSVHPSALELSPGESASFTIDYEMPSQSGDVAAAIRFGGATSGFVPPEIPVSLRTLVPIGPTGGSFTGTLTGGNGRAGVGPYQTYEFDVPAGKRSMSLTLATAADGYLLEGLLVDPNGMQMSVQPNADVAGNQQYGMTLSHYLPQPGRWRFTLVTNYTASGNETSLPFTGRVSFSQTGGVSVSDLPNNAETLISASGKPVTVEVKVTNEGTVSSAYFVDSRLRTPALVELPGYACSGTNTLPNQCGEFILPTEVGTIQFFALATAPIEMDAYNDVGTNVGFTGNPDIFAAQLAPDAVLATLTEPEVPWGVWFTVPSLIGPYGPAGAPTTPVSTAAFALMEPFDASMSGSSGDVWADLTLGTNTYNPLILAPGESGTITVTLTPSAAQVGSTVSGYLYVDTFNPNMGTGDELVRVPYSYTVSK